MSWCLCFSLEVIFFARTLLMSSWLLCYMNLVFRLFYLRDCGTNFSIFGLRHLQIHFSRLVGAWIELLHFSNSLNLFVCLVLFVIFCFLCFGTRIKTVCFVQLDYHTCLCCLCFALQLILIRLVETVASLNLGRLIISQFY